MADNQDNSELNEIGIPKLPAKPKDSGMVDDSVVITAIDRITDGVGYTPGNVKGYVNLPTRKTTTPLKSVVEGSWDESPLAQEKRVHINNPTLPHHSLCGGVFQEEWDWDFDKINCKDCLAIWNVMVKGQRTFHKHDPVNVHYSVAQVGSAMNRGTVMATGCGRTGGLYCSVSLSKVRCWECLRERVIAQRTAKVDTPNIVQGVADPTHHVDAQVESICNKIGVPHREFVGTNNPRPKPVDPKLDPKVVQAAAKRLAEKFQEVIQKAPLNPIFTKIPPKLIHKIKFDQGELPDNYPSVKGGWWQPKKNMLAPTQLIWVLGVADDGYDKSSDPNERVVIYTADSVNLKYLYLMEFLAMYEFVAP